MSQVSLIFACGTALFSDGYANGVVGAVNLLLMTVYPDYFNLTNSNFTKVLNSLIFAGTVLGMLTFGIISDKIGRKAGMMSATAIVAVFSALSAGAYGGGTVGGMVAALSAYRFFLGIGIGAEYPCGSVAASEQTEGPGVNKNAQHRWFALATNTMIDWGFVVAAFVPLVLLWICGMNHLNTVWRITLGLGVIPAVAVFFWRLRMVESARYARDSMKRARMPYGLAIRRYWRNLLAICLTWFIYDFITYPFGIYSSSVVNTIQANQDLYQSFGWSVVINLFYIPGTVVGAFLIDYLGPKNCMILGLILQAIFGFFMSGFYKNLIQPSEIAGFAVLYGLFLTFGELGPGNNLGLLAAKSGPTAFRGQFYGIAAAVGKIGAFVGTWVFPPMIAAFNEGGTNPDRGATGPFWVGSGLAILSALITFFLIRPISHDGMEAEDHAFREYLIAHGYDVSQMGLKEEIISVDSLETEKGNEKEAEASEDAIVQPV
ncbi:MFS general substrate transporter [Dacryopinax primogenitus]|uniref:MFS general substrate transporter n=1 Tax=Dacryopinax primogenitus (strain DJM 731) TaxID=1858805 RepID=M5FQM1_DACPD|nr:MFS general substrate transporter [Dacryopinax primogenitus]EJT97054.1 MFS general substrate transporter [Dacryopinax primogenitus]